MAAVFLNQKLKTKNYLQTVFFSPAILSNIAVGLIFVALLHPEAGLVKQIAEWSRSSKSGTGLAA